MLTIEFSKDPDNVLIDGTQEGLLRLSDAVRTEGDSACDLADSVFPTSIALEGLRVVRRDEPLLLITVDEEQRLLRLDGSAESLEILADNLSSLAGCGPSHHDHIEWFPNHFYLQEGSLPMVASVVATGYWETRPDLWERSQAALRQRSDRWNSPGVDSA